ncbi:MAG: PaaI family thioesterase [Rhodocyclaceae bacterium]|nr:PaaI family thioesterase [Rhodocyclaceae bacterium]
MTPPAVQKFEPRDPQWEAKVRESFALQKVMAYLGAELGEVRPGRCEIRLPCRDELTQQHGFIQAGIVSAIADNAGGYAGFSLMPAGASVLAVEFKINFLAPADGDYLVAVGEIIKPGKTLFITRAEVYAFKDGVPTHCAAMQQTLMNVAPK